MKCLIIEDENMARTALINMCKKCGEFTNIDEAVNATEATKKLNTKKYDVAFLDVVLPEFNGFELAQTSKKLPKVIVTTTEKDFALDAFNHDAVDFLLKPFSYPRFLKAIAKVNQPAVQIPNENKQLFIKVDSKLINVDVQNILYVEAYGDYINIKTKEDRYIVHSTLKAMYEKLPKDIFLKVHRSFIVNINEIEKVQTKNLILDKKIIPISRSNKPKVMQRLKAM